MRVAYLVSHFPSTTETFIPREMLGLEQRGVDVVLYALHHQRGALVQPESAQFLERLRFVPWVSWSMISSQLYWLLRAPGRYVSAWAAALHGNAGSRRKAFPLGGDVLGFPLLP